jgi:outer membrane protein TolC
LEQASNLAALQRERVSIAMHETASAPFQIGEDLTTSPVVSAERRDIAALSKRAERSRPELKAAELSALAYEKQADATRSKALPRLEGLAQTTWANPNQRYFPQRNEFHGTWQVGLQLSFSLSETLNATTQISSARAQAAGAVAQRGQLLDAVRTEVTEAVLSERTARAGLDSSARRLTAAQTSYRARRQRFMVGAATTVELTEAQTELFNAELDAVQARVGIRVALARLNYVIGEGS